MKCGLDPQEGGREFGSCGAPGDFEREHEVAEKAIG